MRLNAYEVLGVSQWASESEIKKAYLSKMRAAHPDVSDDPNAEKIAARINAAYDAIRHGKETFVYNDTPNSQDELETQAQNAINKINNLDYLDEIEKEFYKFVIIYYTTSEIIETALQEAVELNEVRHHIIDIIKGHKYLSDDAKNQYIIRIFETLFGKDFLKIQIEAVKENEKMKEIRQAQQEAKEEIRKLYFDKIDKRQEVISYIENCVSKDEIERAIRMVKKRSSQIRPIIELRKMKVELKYMKSPVIDKQFISDYRAKIRGCHTIEELDAYETMINILEKIFSELRASQDSEILEMVIDLADSELLKDLLREYKANFATKVIRTPDYTLTPDDSFSPRADNGARIKTYKIHFPKKPLSSEKKKKA
ncbi:MAG: DnaJ domain-containing protein [Bacilli bacterium]|nr:DnaJ domain-containing protein [Bacilli bacterium]MBR3209009.1 DnaJ domain-containing protein [Bacilli bacterium]